MSAALALLCLLPPAACDGLNLTHATSFVVTPRDTNANYPMLFGGKTLAEMDRCAGITTRRLLYASKVRDAVTVGIEKVKFVRAGKVKDLLFVTGRVVALGAKTVTVRVVVERETAEGRELLAEGVFVFAAFDAATKRAAEHGLTLPRKGAP